ncbi:MAG: hypothetical protein IT436_17650 [Phycisphaerales bacterium]|nr:hypothetical protein [Phycisphaerales bacterium]
MGWFSKKKEAASPVQAAPGPDFAALAAAAAADAKAMGALWRAVYQLEQWHFVARGSMPEPRPHAVDLDGKGFLAAFTDGASAHRWAVSQKACMDDGSFAVLSMPTENAAAYAAGYVRSGIFGLVFDLDRSGFFAPLTNLLPMHLWELGRLPGGVSPAVLGSAFDFDRAVRAARATSDNARAASLLRAIFELDRWVLLSTTDNPMTPCPWPMGEQMCLVVFTDLLQGERMLKVAEKAGLSSAPQLMEAAPAALIDVLERLPAAGVKQVVFNPCGEFISMPIEKVIAGLRPASASAPKAGAGPA